MLRSFFDKVKEWANVSENKENITLLERLAKRSKQLVESFLSMIVALLWLFRKEEVKKNGSDTKRVQRLSMWISILRIARKHSDVITTIVVTNFVIIPATLFAFIYNAGIFIQMAVSAG